MTTLLHATTDAAVVMDILGGNAPSYEPIDLPNGLAEGRLPAVKVAGPALRLVRVGERVTRSAVERLEAIAARLVFDDSLASLEHQIGEASAQSGDPSEPLWFLYEFGKAPLQVSAASLARNARLWAKNRALRQADFEIIRHGVVQHFEVKRLPSEGINWLLIAYERGGTADVTRAWEQFEQSLVLSGAAQIHTSASGRVVITAPSRTPAEATAALRDELLKRGWPTSEEVGRRYGSQSANRGQWAKDRRDAGELLGVLSVSERTFRHPDFQFDEHGRIRPEVKPLLDALALRKEFRNLKEEDKSGWRRAFWLYGASPALAGADGIPLVPADVFLTDPAKVIDLARKEAEADPDGNY